jgi:hypothetical protein
MVVRDRGARLAHGAGMLRTTILMASLLAACATAPDPDGSGGGKADGDETTIAFASDFTDAADGPVVAGGTVRIRYDLSRLTGCRGESNGSEAWGVTGWAQFGSSEPTSFAVSRIANGKVVPLDAELAIPASATSVALWFSESNVWGCIAYDSNEGANYQFDVQARDGTELLVFDADFTQSLPAIHGGDRAIVHFAPERLAQCEGSTGGHPAWGITGHWQVDGNAVHDITVTRPDGDTLVASDPSIAVPRGHDLALWFEATNIWGCHAWDSADGANYHASIE